MSTVLAQVLQRFQHTLTLLCEEAGQRKGTLGEPPVVIFVEQKVPSDHPCFNTGAALRRWRVTREEVVEVPLTTPLPEQKRSGMYYDSGRGDFAVATDGTRVRTGWQVGPRYGRGFDLPVVDGVLSADGRPIWMS